MSVDPTVQVAVIAGVFGLLSILTQQHLARGHRRDLAVVKEHVTNSHGTNLRDDLDFIRDLVIDVRADFQWLRRDHLALIERVTHLERTT